MGKSVGYEFSGGLSLSMPVGCAERVLSSCDGVCALVYIYLLRTGGELDVAKAAADLQKTEKEICAAAEKLTRLDVISPKGAGAIPVTPEELPQYAAADIVSRTEKDAEFSGVLQEVQRILGRILSTPDLNKLFGIYDYLGMPGEVMVMLVGYCAEEFSEKYGADRTPGMRYIEKKAYEWMNREIMTLDRAEEYIRTQRVRKSETAKIARVLQIRDRELSATEMQYVDNWMEMGFGADAVDIAYDRTVIKTGKLHWRYLDSIIRSWNDKGLHTPEEIEAGDGFNTGPKKEQRKPYVGNARQKDDLELMEKLMGNKKP